MSDRERTPAFLPPHLVVETIGSLAPDSPRFVDADYVYSDGPRAFLSKEEEITPKALIPRITGRIAIMLSTLPTCETGYVVDMRFLKDGYKFAPAAGEEAPSDSEDFNDWQADKEHEIPVAAIVYRNPGSDKNELSGDEDFFDAATYLAREVDELKAGYREKKLRKATTDETSEKKTLGDRIGQRILRVKMALGLPLY